MHKIKNKDLSILLLTLVCTCLYTQKAVAFEYCGMFVLQRDLPEIPKKAKQLFVIPFDVVSSSMSKRCLSGQALTNT